MENVYLTVGGRRLVVFDEGNNINLVHIAGPRKLQWNTIRRDYASDIYSSSYNGRICLVYVNTANELVWDVIGNDNRIVLSINRENAARIKNVRIYSIDGNMVVTYQAKNSENGMDEIIYVLPEGERKGKVLVAGTDIEDYFVVEDGEESLLRYKLRDEEGYRTYTIKLNKLGDINLEQYVICKARVMRELENSCELLRTETAKKIEEANQKKDDIMCEKLGEMEEKYKQQYNELVSLTREIQEEGRHFRELYYRSIKR